MEVDDLWSAARMDSVDGVERTGPGRAFQSTTVLGQKEHIVREESGMNVSVPHRRVCLEGCRS